MQTQQLGGTFTFKNTSRTVHRLGYGAMRLTGPKIWGPPKDPDQAVAILRAAVEAGVDHIDTADFYGPHVTNQLISRALAPYRDDLTIVTKVGFVRPADGSWRPAFSAADLTTAVHDNLRNLGLERLDVVNLRVGGPAGRNERSLAEPLRALVELQGQGLIRSLGISNASDAQVREACEITDIVCVQNEYNLTKRDDDAMIDELGRQGIAYTPFFPLGGFTPLQSSVLDETAKALDATPMQVALAWLLQRAPNMLLIPGTSSLDHLRENLAAAELRFSAEQLSALDAMSSKT